MGHLNLEPNLTSPDDFYEALIEAHTGLADEMSEALNNRLILVLANHIGDQDVLIEAIKTAKK